MGQRVDALYLAFRGEISTVAYAEFRSCVRYIEQVRTDVAGACGPFSFAMNCRSKEGRWTLENDDWRVRIEDAAHLKDWRLVLMAKAQSIADRGAFAMLLEARRLAAILLTRVEEERLRRLDLCVDLVGMDLHAIEAAQWRTPRRTARVKAIGTIEEHFKEGKRTGWGIGKTPIQLRAYDKLEELNVDQMPARVERRLAEYARWKANGWNGSDPVTRVEFQLGGDALKELLDGTGRDPETALNDLDSIWKYCTCKWTRLAIVDSSSRHCRWKTDPIWDVVRSAVFAIEGAEAATRSRIPSAASALFVMSTMVRHGARRGVYGTSPPEDMREWPAEKAKQFVEDQVGELALCVTHAVLREVLEARGPQGAAEYIVAKRNAALAKVSKAVAPASSPSVSTPEVKS